MINSSLYLFFEDTHIGDEIPPLIKEIKLVQNAMYSAATWDFFRFHYDGEFAQRLGFPGSNDNSTGRT